MARNTNSRTKHLIQMFAALVAAFGILVSAVASLRADGDYHWRDTFSDYFDSAGDTVHAFDIAPSGSVYVGGYFTHVGPNIEVNHVAMWDGTAWHPLGRGVGANFGVLPHFSKIIALSDTQVYFAGFFATLRNDPNANCSAETISVNGIARWDGTCWHGLGPDADSLGVRVPAYAEVGDMEFFNGELWITGHFEYAGDTEAHGIAKWNGGGWEALGDEPNFGMNTGYGGALATNGTELFIGGTFSGINGASMAHVAKYSPDGGFVAMGAGLANLNVETLIVAEQNVFAGGVPTDNSDAALFSFDGATWSIVGNGIRSAANGGQVLTLAYQNNLVYVGGLFDNVGYEQTMLNLALWNMQTEAWSEFGNPNGAVYHIAFDDGLTFIGGDFAQVGGKQSIHLAIYDPNASPPPAQANLDVSLTVTENTVNSGDALAFCVTVQNYGPDTATGVVLTTSVPNGATFEALSFDDCYGGGGGETRNLKRANGFAFPMLAPNCETPNVGQAGAIECALDDLPQWDSQTIRVDMTVTASPNSQIQINASASGNEMDSNENNNAAIQNVTVRPIVTYVSANGDCANSAPCFEYLYEAFSALASGGTVNVLAGTYNESLYLYDNNTVNLLGDVTLNGELYLNSGVVNAGDDTFTVNGNLYNSSATFNHNSGTFRFNSGGTQYINGAFQFFNVVIERGTTLDLGQNALNFTGALTNNGTLQNNSAPEYVGQGSEGIFEDATNQETVRLISTGANDLGETYVSVVMGQPAPQCGGNDLPAPRSILRHFDISPSGYENINATVRLTYSAAELNGADPSTVKIYHCNGSDWEALPSQPGPNGTYYVQAQGVISFSPFALGGNPFAPTATTLVAARAKLHHKGGAHVKWETGSELNVLGFNVHRSAQRAGTYKQVNAKLKHAKVMGQPMGTKYALRDKKAQAGKTYFYKIEIVRADGTAEWSEPIKLKMP